VGGDVEFTHPQGFAFTILWGGEAAPRDLNPSWWGRRTPARRATTLKSPTGRRSSRLQCCR